jgi:hypothetical protein
VKFIKLVDACIVSSLRNICFVSILKFYSIVSQLHMRGLKKHESPLQLLLDLPLSPEFARLFPAIQQKAVELFESPIFRVDVVYKSELQWTPCECSVQDIIDGVRR